MKLLEKLNQFAHLTPDEIAARIADPFPTWAQGDVVTAELIEQYAELRIVICNVSRRTNPRGRVERHHRLSSYQGPARTRWDLNDWHRGTLQPGGPWWFRSLASYEANPDEGF